MPEEFKFRKIDNWKDYAIECMREFCQISIFAGYLNVQFLTLVYILVNYFSSDVVEWLFIVLKSLILINFIIGVVLVIKKINNKKFK